ncbi:hypothetical protein PALB_37480 [Pseudoalteromonas luteoviolacea B = ATCC 29581]|nr:hypothetical protein PALB_37480 [Pseudoalteromonas luteoviolacea B = ATCC 29581]
MKVLLVDDDQLILRALKRSLIHLDNTLEIHVIDDPLKLNEAIVEHGTPTILFSDFNMPNYTGCALLNDAKQLCPEALRCLLSGDMTTDFSLQVNNQAHFYLAKPFTKSQLQQVLEAAKQLEKLPVGDIARKALGQLEQIPVVSDNIKDILRLLRTQERLAVVADKLSENGAVSAKLIQVANSAMLGFSASISTVEDAVIRLGVDFVEVILLSYDLENKAESSIREHVVKANRKAFQKAILARDFATRLGLEKRQTEQLQLVCLLSALGDITERVNSDEALKQLDRTIISAYLLSLWGFSEITAKSQLVFDSTQLAENKLTLMHAAIELVVDPTYEDCPKNWPADVYKQLFERNIYDNWHQWKNEFSI